MVCLYEILVPTRYGDTEKPIRTVHHKRWDEKVRQISGGLTIFHPGKGQWLHDGELIAERVIPVRVACTPGQIEQIVETTLDHYRQKAVMFYKVTDHVEIRHAS